MPLMMSHFSPFPIDTPALRVQGLGVQELMQPCSLNRPRGWANYLFVVFYDATPCRTPAGDVRVPAGTVICLRPGTPHAIGNAGRPWNHSWLSVAGTDVSRTIRETRLPTDMPLPLHDLTFFDPALTTLYDELCRPAAGGDALDPRVVRNDVVSLIRRLARAVRPTSARPRVPQALLDLRRHIDSHSHAPLTLLDLADRAAMSVSQLCFLHQRHFGSTVMAYVRLVRLNRAAVLLRDTDMKASAVAVQVGFPDPFHFSKAFHRHFGMPPGRFRRLHRTFPPSVAAAR